MYNLEYTNQFKRSFKKCLKCRLDINIFYEAVNILAKTDTLPLNYKPHKLSGKYKNCLEYNLQPD